MRAIGLRAAAGLMLVACGFDTGGVASGTASVGGDETTTSTAGDDAPDDGPGSADDDDADADASATTPDSGNPTGSDDPTAEPTSDPTAEPTTTGDEQGSTGVLESTTDGGESTTGVVDPTTDGGDDLPPENPYPNCSGEDVCADAAQNCIELTNQWDDVLANACAPPCDVVEDCPGAPQGNATPACVSGFCRLECDESTTCPDDMMCWEVYMAPDVCLYPD